MANNIYHYYVKGDDEKKVVDTLKTSMQLIISGKVDVFNVIERKFTRNQIMRLKQGTIVVLVFDTDTNKIDVLLENIRFLKKQSIIKKVICIPQVKNLEQELIESCNIKQIKELTGSKSNSNYKHDLIQHKNLSNALKLHGFNIENFWCKEPSYPFDIIKNESSLIKK